MYKLKKTAVVVALFTGCLSSASFSAIPYKNIIPLKSIDSFSGDTLVGDVIATNSTSQETIISVKQESEWVKQATLPSGILAMNIDENALATVNTCNTFSSSYNGGKVFVYERKDGSWSEDSVALSSDEAILCNRVDVDGDTIIAGGERSDSYVFSRDEQGLWSEQAAFTVVSQADFNSDGYERQEALDVIRANANDQPITLFHVYLKTETIAGKQKQTYAFVLPYDLTIDIDPDGFNVGLGDIAIDGNTALFNIGASSNSDLFGRVSWNFYFIFQREGETWTLQTDLNNLVDTGMGIVDKVSLSGNTVAMHDNSRYIHIFERTETTWTKTQKIERPLISGCFHTSHSFTLEGSTLATTHCVEEGQTTPDIHIYRQSNNGWKLFDRLDTSNTSTPHISGDMLIIKAPDVASSMVYTGIKDGGSYIGLSATSSFSNQDDTSRGSVVTNASGNTLNLSENRWRATKKTFNITKNSVLSFDLNVEKIGEVHGIGFMAGDQVQSDKVFQVAGFQSLDPIYWNPITDYHYTGGTQSITIPVGQHYTGKNLQLVLVHDNDGVSGSQATFSNIQLCEGECKTTETVNPGEANRAIDLRQNVSFSAQDSAQNSRHTTANNGAQLNLQGNTWRQSQQSYTLTEDTILTFSFSTDEIAELQGIGLDNGSQKRFFQIAGYENFLAKYDGNQDYQNYILSNEPQQFNIPIGQFITGNNYKLVFFNDNDAYGESWAANNTATFYDVRICEAECNDDNSSEQTRTVENIDLSFDTVEFGNQGAEGIHGPLLNGYGFELEGNHWRASVNTYTITPDTILEFDYDTRHAYGEMLGIGFDEDNEPSSDRMFNLAGNHTWWGITDYRYTMYTQRFSIPVGQYYTGESMHMVFMSDNDSRLLFPRTVYSNMRLCEGSCE